MSSEAPREAPREAPAQRAEITTESPSNVAISYPQRRTKVFQIFEHEFASLTSIGNSLDLSLCGVAFGSSLSLGITMATVDFTTPLMRGSFIAGLIVSVVFTVFFGIRSAIGVSRMRKQINRIKSESLSVSQ